MIRNPFKDSADSHQELSWGHFPEKKKYHFELILPLKAIGQLYVQSRHCEVTSGYLPVCAECIETIKKGEWDWVINGSFCVINLPILTLERAWLSVSYAMRKEITEEDNLKVVFLKKNKQAMAFEHVERLKPKPEHIEFSEKIYSGQQPRQKTKVAKEEY